MKKITLILVVVLTIFSCDKEQADFIYQEYQLPNHCILNVEENKAIVINDADTFHRIFAEYPNIKSVDFSKYTLLLTKGISSYEIAEIKKQVSKDDYNKYNFVITVEMSWFTVLESWCLAYIIPKTNPEDITLSIKYNQLSMGE